jgi:NitT/TauT family transport system substrate-binding protein
VSAADTIRLEWIIQGQFAGFIVAADKGYYKEAGADIELVPAGPDIKPAVVVAQGTDTFGIGHPNQVIAARANEAPLVSVLQFGQDSASVYISRKEKGITGIKDMPGHSVGLWFGGDEHEFLAMLNAGGVKPEDVTIISQGFDIIQWLNDEYDVMQVTLFNELLQVYEQGIGPDQLNVMHPRDYGVAMVSGGLFVNEKTINERPELVQAVVSATMRGWQDALNDPEGAAKIVLKYNSELELPHQINQIKAMGALICQGPTLEGKFGFTEKADYEVAQKILLDAKLIEKEIDLDRAFTNRFWEAAPAEYKQVKCG